MKTLDRKVMRDIRRLGSQAVTIALVVASSIGGFVACLSAVDSLALARERFYERAHFADLFVSLKRAPIALAAQLQTLPGVAHVQPTVETVARITTSDSTDPALGQLIGLDLDATQTARLNQVSLRSGQWPSRGAAANGELQVLVSEGFALAHHMRPGARATALINGRQRVLRMTGVALSPEYVFAGLWGMPDVRGFGVFWLDQQALAAALDMTEAFNHVAFALAPGASLAHSMDAIDRQLAPVGGQPAISRRDQISNAMLDNEIVQQRVLGTLLPAIFLLVASFLIHVFTARLIATQREQLALLKALGFSNAAIALHYFKLVSPMVLTGYGLGLALGAVLGQLMLGLYAEVFHFPVFGYRLGADLVLWGLLLALLAAVLGTLTPLAALVRLSPAEAMRPQAPARYRPALLERLPWLRTGPALRMILRNMERRPLRTTLTTLGMASALALVVVGNFFRDAMDTIVDANFVLALRGDLVVWTTEAVNGSAARGLERIPGVLQVEAGRQVPVRFVHGQRTQSGALQGVPAGAQLNRVIDLDLRRAHIHPEGLTLSDRLADKLQLRPGQAVTVEVLEGQRRTQVLVLQRTVRDMMGLNAYMDAQALHRLLGETDVATQFTLAVQRGTEAAVLHATQAMPRVAGAFSKATMLRNMQDISARNILIMSAILTGFAAVIAVGVVYNSARIALGERYWELASLRVLGFTRAEVSGLLLGELALLLLLALPLGMALGWALTHVLVQQMHSDQFMFPVVIRPRTYALAALCIVGAGVASALVVRQRIDRLDLVAALKARE
ncbi:ABC transporter permease [Rhodoferax lacus]|uniref:ABC transporter permease n=1 Tax=Rhodoferax lacus TaxID=2184758 RepID=A0A3E1R9V6_9BURK|nr:ABC transporter permease [Rhodoferax lacus]RFO96043.1 ABC transporter permease [Rhodoferax lacus]